MDLIVSRIVSYADPLESLFTYVVIYIQAGSVTNLVT